MSCGNCGCNKTSTVQNNYDALMGLGELTEAQTLQIVTDHFKNLPATTLTAIALETASGKYDTLAAEVRKLMEEVCTAGASDKIGEAIKKYWWVIAGAVLGIIAFIYFF